MWRAVLLLVIVSGLVPAQDAISVFKQGDYKSAIPLLEAAIQQSPKDVVLRASLLSALVYEGRLEDASAAAEQGERDFADSPEMLAARGEYAFYIADMGAADSLFRQALKLKDQTPRAYYGLSRLHNWLAIFERHGCSS